MMMSGSEKYRMPSLESMLVEMSHEIKPPTAACSALTMEEGATRYCVRLSDGPSVRTAPPGLPDPPANDTLPDTAPTASTLTAVHPAVSESKVLLASTAAEARSVTMPLTSRNPVRTKASTTPGRVCIVSPPSISVRECLKWQKVRQSQKFLEDAALRVDVRR